jgi:hypothetical protein
MMLVILFCAFLSFFVGLDVAMSLYVSLGMKIDLYPCVVSSGDKWHWENVSCHFIAFGLDILQLSFVVSVKGDLSTKQFLGLGMQNFTSGL